MLRAKQVGRHQSVELADAHLFQCSPGGLTHHDRRVIGQYGGGNDPSDKYTACKEQIPGIPFLQLYLKKGIPAGMQAAQM
jgi:hypothetical protein